MLLVSLGLALLVFGGLLVSAVQNSSAYYFTLEELLDKEDTTRMLRVKGELVPASVIFDPQGPRLAFSLTDGKNAIAATYRGATPDNFLHADEIIVEGFLTDGILRVEKILLQCPSKYETEEGR